MLILKQKLKIKFDHSNREKNSYPYVCIIVPLSLHHTPLRSFLAHEIYCFLVVIHETLWLRQVHSFCL